MEKAYDISEIYFDHDFIVLVVDNQTIRVRLADISDKLAKATNKERMDFKISPSGYGIHWVKLDEDLSVNGLLRIKGHHI